MSLKAVPLFNTSSHNLRPVFAVAPAAPSDAEVALQRERAELAALKANYEKSLRELAATRETIMRDTMGELRELAFAVGRELALKELAASPDAVQRLVSDLVGGLGGRKGLEVRVAEEDVERVRLPSSSDVRVVGDSSLSPGSCVIQAADCKVDASFDGREDRVRGALGLVQ